MTIQEGDFIKINFTGRIKNTGEIYNSTIEEIAREAGVYDEKGSYRLLSAIVGKTPLFPEVTEAIIGSEIGDKLTVDVPFDHAFGPRDPKLVQLMHVKEFKKQGINPVPGLIVQNNGTQGKILTVNGGRVKVDYNNYLAGKDLICEVEICELIEDDDGKINGIIESIYPNGDINFDITKLIRDGDVLNIILDPTSKMDQQPAVNITLKKYEIAREIYSLFDEIKQVNFVDEFTIPENSSEESAEEVSEEKDSEEKTAEE